MIRITEGPFVLKSFNLRNYTLKVVETYERETEGLNALIEHQEESPKFNFILEATKTYYSTA